MKHLILCREFPPAPYAPGGIGVYAQHISRLLAERGEIVHVIGQRWRGAPKRTEELCDGRLIIHRISLEDTELYPAWGEFASAKQLADAVERSAFGAEWFSWVAAGLAEQLIEQEQIDVIEAQEWEAPLYYLLLRRTLGLGPAKSPPCIVHFHSPTEYIYRHNEWDLARPEYTAVKRLEDFAILAADAHLCPSAYLARQCVERYQIEDDIEVIALPLGTSKWRARTRETWDDGAIFYSGRLEPRKGIIEFVDAAVAVARDDPSLRFDFVGSDNKYNEHVSMLELLQPRIPPELRACFRFHGGQTREQLLEMLVEARLAVVPSRWENFPNTCLEALSSGLPVVATRNGGMAEMIEDGVTGWLAPDGPEPLAARIEIALRRALATKPEELARMGETAARSIGAMCDNELIAGRHAEYRREVSQLGAKASTSFPEAYAWPNRPDRPVPLRHAAGGEQRRVVVIVVALLEADPAATLASLAAQDRVDEILVVSRVPPASTVPHIWLEFGGSSAAAAKELALARCGDATLILVVDATHTLAAGSVAQLAAQLDRNPAVGAAGAWRAAADGSVEWRPEQPAFPHQWVHDGLSGLVMYRREAIVSAGGFDLATGRGHDEWDLVTRIMAEGWLAVRVPLVLSRRDQDWMASAATDSQACYARARIAAHLPALAGEDVVDLLLLQGAPGPKFASGSEEAEAAKSASLHVQARTFAQILALPLPEQVAAARMALKDPRATAEWTLWRLKSMLRRR